MRVKLTSVQPKVAISDKTVGLVVAPSVKTSAEPATQLKITSQYKQPILATNQPFSAFFSVGPALRFTTLPTGPQGPPGASSTEQVFTASTNVSGHKLVYLTDNSEITHAGNDIPAAADLTLGVSLNAATPGNDVTVKILGEVEFGGWNFTPDEPLFLGLDGALVQTVPSSNFVLPVGVAMTNTKIWVKVGRPIFLA